MRHYLGVLTLLFTSVGLSQSQQNATSIKPDDNYRKALAYIRSCTHDHVLPAVRTFLAESHLLDTTSTGKSLGLVVSKHVMRSQFYWFSANLPDSGRCNPTNLKGVRLVSFLSAIDSANGVVESIEWPDSLTHKDHPDLVVFFSAPFKNLLSAEVFKWLDPKDRENQMVRGDINQIYSEYASFNSGLMFLFCGDAEGDGSVIYVRLIAHD